MAESSFTVSDPFIWRDDAAKCYRLYQLSRMSEPVGAGVMMRTSTNLTDWSAMTQVLRVPDSYGCSAVWAPEMHVYKGAYYIFGTICTKLCPTNCVRPMAEKGWQPKGNYLHKRLSTYIFKSDRPEGPFKVWSDGPIPPRDWATLDGTFFEEDGKPYMVFCHEWTQMRDGTMDAVELTPDLTRAAGRPVTLFRASDLWKEDAAKFPTRTYVTDGPFLYRSKTGTTRSSTRTTRGTAWRSARSRGRSRSRSIRPTIPVSRSACASTSWRTSATHCAWDGRSAATSRRVLLRGASERNK